MGGEKKFGFKDSAIVGAFAIAVYSIEDVYLRAQYLQEVSQYVVNL